MNSILPNLNYNIQIQKNVIVFKNWIKIPDNWHKKIDTKANNLAHTKIKNHIGQKREKETFFLKS